MKRRKLSSIILNGAFIGLISLLGVFIAVNFLKVGISWNEVLLLLGIPLFMGIVAHYLIFE